MPPCFDDEAGLGKAQVGERTVVVVEHDMDFMRAFATSVTVLARGQVIAEGSVAEVQANPKVQEVYLGTAAAGTDAPQALVEAPETASSTPDATSDPVPDPPAPTKGDH